jgi:hypothetical protein
MTMRRIMFAAAAAVAVGLYAPCQAKACGGRRAVNVQVQAVQAQQPRASVPVRYATHTAPVPSSPVAATRSVRQEQPVTWATARVVNPPQYRPASYAAPAAQAVPVQQDCPGGQCPAARGVVISPAPVSRLP